MNSGILKCLIKKELKVEVQSSQSLLLTHRKQETGKLIILIVTSIFNAERKIIDQFGEHSYDEKFNEEQKENLEDLKTFIKSSKHKKK